jgi:hypothetical protein
MVNLFIIKGGIRNVVDEATFERVYKPNGWVIDETRSPQSKSAEQELKIEDKIRNYAKAKKKTDKVFNDDLIKRGE